MFTQELPLQIPIVNFMCSIHVFCQSCTEGIKKYYLLTGSVPTILSCTARICSSLLIYWSLFNRLVAVSMIKCECAITPEGHEDGKEDGGWVVEQVAGSRCTTRSHQFPVAAGAVTQWTHGDVVPGIANLHTDNKEIVGRDELFKEVEDSKRMVERV